MSLANLIKHPTGSLVPGVWKRKGSDEDDENDESSELKKPRYSWHVTLEDESPDHTEESDDETIYSIQNEETEYARDTSDTSTSAWINPNESGNMVIGVEYDLATSSDSDNPFLDSSTSDPDEILSVNVLASLNESDIGSERVEDTDASLTSADSELGKADYWTCGQCNTTNNNPLFRYCERCYQLRKNLFPPRPRSKKSQKSSASEISSQTSTLSRIDSGVDSQPTSQTLSTDCDPEMSSQTETLSIEDGATSGVYISGTSGEQKTEDEEFIKKIKLAQERIESKEDLDNKYCLVCTVVPKNGAFVHGNAAHICCCYQCAVKVWKATKQCPICNRKVTKVVKVFYT